jgi:hypothetical protein
MYWKYKGQLYGETENHDMHQDAEHKPEPIFTLEEMKECYDMAYLDGEERRWYGQEKYFKDNFNIKL